ncbi:MAG: DUF3459 domain-containing protein, partial [Gemmataceae bacterium]|nr:DUF3459 domain-containing protein [Gemmataceae bacterium]
TTPWGEAINYDGAYSDEVRRFFVDNALMWLREYHFDGLRLDAVHAILDTSAYHVLEQLADEVRDLGAHLGRQLVLIAESDLNDPRIVRAPEVGGYGLDAQWSDDFHHALHTVLTGEQSGYYRAFGGLDRLATALRRAFVYAGEDSPHRRRRYGRVPLGLSGQRMLGFIQNHDQIGNRARGERIGQLVSPGRVKVAAALVLTAPFVPMLFQGEEWAASSPFQYFTDHEDRELGRLVTEGRRREFASFGWNPDDVPDPQAAETFRRSRLDWSERAEPAHAEILDWHRRLIRLRHASPALVNGRLDQVRVRFDEQGGWLVVERGPFRVACNFGPAEQAVPLGAGGPWETALASEAEIEIRDGAIALPPDAVAIVREAGAA